jgi:3-deoxy-D-manno-octulosonic-acid transferase
LLVDVIGRLGALYKLASVAFVGGSLVPIGGHNVLEPAAHGVPVLFGPHTHHFAEPVAALIRAGGGVTVSDGTGLARELSRLLEDEGRRRRVGRGARQVVEANRGAMARSLELIFESLEETGSVPSRRAR